MTRIRTIGIIDVETTSLDSSTGHVIEVALGLFSIEHGALIRARSWLCAAPAEAVTATEHVHGIPPALVAARGVPFEEVAKQIHAITTKEIDVLAAHQADFDRAWFPLFVQNAVPWICTLEDIKWPHRSTSRALTAIALAHGVGVVRAHRAMDDVLTLAALFDRAAELGEDLEAMLAHAMRPKARFAVADTTFDEARNVLAKEHGFRWEKPNWIRAMAIADTASLPFAVRQVTA